MKNKHFLLLFLLISVFACTKNNSGKPTISIESATSVVPVDGTMEIKLKFTQSNGKLSGGTFIAIRQRLNIIPTPPSDQLADTIPGVIPEFPDKDKGEFVFSLPWNNLHEYDVRNDTIAFKFLAIDTENDSSDAVVTGPIAILIP
jgi:hypothetical protein